MYLVGIPQKIRRIRDRHDCLLGVAFGIRECDLQATGGFKHHLLKAGGLHDGAHWGPVDIRNHESILEEGLGLGNDQLVERE